MAKDPMPVDDIFYDDVDLLGEELCETNAKLANLRQQVEQLTADAIVRANRQAILVEAMRHIQAFSTSNRDRQIATQALTAIGMEPQEGCDGQRRHRSG